MSEQANIEAYKACMNADEGAHWRRGELAVQWLEGLAGERSQNDYARLVGDTRQSINQHVSVFRAFGKPVCRQKWTLHWVAIENTECVNSARSWLEVAARNQWSKRELVRAIRTESVRRQDVERVEAEDADRVQDLDAAVKAGRKFGTLYVDPPWRYSKTVGEGACEDHYNTMSLDEIAALPVGELAAEKCHLHLWTTNAFLFDCQRLFEVWGFEFKSSLIWIKSDSQTNNIWELKPQLGLGNYWRCCHEFLLTGVRGGLTFDDRTLPSWVAAKRTVHSRKPEIVRSMIERASPGPRLELFARERSRGWAMWGNQVGESLIA